MSTETPKRPDDSLRISETDRNISSGTEANTVMSQIRSLRSENEKLRREKMEIEQKSREQVVILEAQLQDEKEKRENADEFTRKAEETLKIEKREKMKLIENLETEKKQKVKAQEKEKEEISKFVEKEKECLKLEQQLRYEIEEKNEANQKYEMSESMKKTEIEKRRKAESEKNQMSWKYNQMKNDIERFDKEVEMQTNLASEFEIKYYAEVKEKEKEKKNADDAEIRRKEAEILQKSEQKKKDFAVNRLETAEKSISELESKLSSSADELSIIKEEFEQERLKFENEAMLNIQEQLRRKEVESEKLKVEGENIQLKKENEQIRYKFVQLKDKFGEQKFEEEVKAIEKIDKDKDEEVLKLRNENEILKKDKELQMKRIEEAEEKAQKEEQEMQKEKLENENKEKQLRALIADNSKMKIEIENLKIKIPLDVPISIINNDPSDIILTDVDDKIKKISKKTVKHNIVSLSQILDKGVGIVRDSFTLLANTDPRDSSQNQHIVFLGSSGFQPGGLQYKGNENSGNVGFKDNQIVRAEFDSEKGTLTFFIDNVQQPVSVSGIKEKVRFIICMYHAGSTCTIRSLKKLAAPTSGHVDNEKTVSW
ncbi:MAG: hypothetical protein EZS28_008230 [Streblomastix strix]|uniref:SPRY domain-containing protein n=1 Tax=Streblomastix strix TaxID=222440 RepID=A0A5J4WMX9_9EUKA|nr:MAG: hypothetical protein EZS28_008230 [Streblomastix strix]